jgi:pimeloyl-ACP methyl ester carboxylesterase
MKWFKRIAFGLAALIVLALLVGLSYEQWSRMRAARAFPPLGDLVEVDGRQGHLYCTGEGSPTVILEAGLDPFGALVWGMVQPDIASMTRVCSYDRAGIMWSEPGLKPRDAHRVADELQALLEASPESPPYVMVGHSLGGLFQLVYDARHPGEVSGFVFVDSSHPEQMERFPEEIVETMNASLPPPLLARALARLGVIRMLGLVTGDVLPEERQAPARSLAPQSTVGMVGEMVALEAIASQAQATVTLGSRPVVVLTAGIQDPLPGIEVSAAVQRETVSTWSELQEEIAGLSTNSERRVIERSAHYIQLEAPEAVIAAVLDVVTAAREGTPVVPGEASTLVLESTMSPDISGNHVSGLF